MNFIEEKRRGEGKGEGGRRGEGRGGEEGVKLTKTMQFYHLFIFIIHLFFIMIDYRVFFIKNYR